MGEKANAIFCEKRENLSESEKATNFEQRRESKQRLRREPLGSNPDISNLSAILLSFAKN